MSNFVLVPGAGGATWYWSRVVPLLERAGHTAVAVDLPGADESAGLPEYVGLVTAAIGGRPDIVLVAQSLGAFTAAVVASQVPVETLVLVNPMIPLPKETAGAWWGATGAEDAREAAARTGGYGDFDEVTYFLHDVPAAVAAEGAGEQRPEAGAVFGSVAEFSTWPAVPTRVLSGADDRFFPLEFQRAVAQDRLGIEPDVRPGGHLIALSQPELVAAYLLNR